MENRASSHEVPPSCEREPLRKRLFASPTGTPSPHASSLRTILEPLCCNVTRRLDDSPPPKSATAPTELTLGKRQTRSPISAYFRQRKCRTTSLKQGRSLEATCPQVINNLLQGLAITEASPLATGHSQHIPTIDNPDIGLPSISPEVLAALVQRGPQRFGLQHLLLVDARYDYEYLGGHIVGARHHTRPMEPTALLHTDDGVLDGATTAVVFYCEFSSERGPRMFRHARNRDREAHLVDYPALSVPHMFVLKGGYKAFVGEYPHLCVPEAGYVGMFDPAHDAARLKHRDANQREWGKAKKRSMLQTLLGRCGDDDEEVEPMQLV